MSMCGICAMEINVIEYFVAKDRQTWRQRIENSILRRREMMKIVITMNENSTVSRNVM